MPTFGFGAGQQRVSCLRCLIWAMGQVADRLHDQPHLPLGFRMQVLMWMREGMDLLESMMHLWNQEPDAGQDVYLNEPPTP